MKKEIKDIYSIKNDINNKIYIGQTVNPIQRWAQYKSAVKKNPNGQLITKAMAKYGIEHFHMEILEKQITNYDEREKYYIQLFNSITPNGYNVAEGGQGSGSGIYSTSSLIKDEQTLSDLQIDLIENVLLMKEISEKYNIGLGQLSELNQGHTYYDSSLKYPLRPIKRYSEEKLKQITYSLKYELDKSMTDIAKEYSIDKSHLNDINQGNIAFREYLTYPIRIGKMKKAEVNIPKIQKLLLESNLSQREIAQQFNLSTVTISSINLGNTGFNPNLEYPLRLNPQNHKHYCLSPDHVSHICDLLKNSTMSIRDIAKQEDVLFQVICGINTGSIKKYRDDNKYIYPIR